MNLNDLDPKHRALVALVAAANEFFEAAVQALNEKHPGRGMQDRLLLDGGHAHLIIAIQAGSGQIKASLGLTQPEFIETIAAPELELHGSLEAIFSEKSKMIDLRKLD